MISDANKRFGAANTVVVLAAFAPLPRSEEDVTRDHFMLNELGLPTIRRYGRNVRSGPPASCRASPNMNCPSDCVAGSDATLPRRIRTRKNTLQSSPSTLCPWSPRPWAWPSQPAIVGSAKGPISSSSARLTAGGHLAAGSGHALIENGWRVLSSRERPRFRSHGVSSGSGLPSQSSTSGYMIVPASVGDAADFKST